MRVIVHIDMDRGTDELQIDIGRLGTNVLGEGESCLSVHSVSDRIGVWMYTVQYEWIHYRYELYKYQ